MRKSNNKNKVFNIIIFVLFIMLIFMIYTIIHNYNTKANTQAFNQAAPQSHISTKTDDYATKLEKLQTKLQETNELLVLEGTTQINCTYDNSNVLNTKDDNLNFLHRKFNELKIREIQVETEYKFGFTYNLDDIQVIKDNDKIKIMLPDHRLKLKYIEEDKNKTVLTDKINLLASKFTPQEINTIMARTKIGTLNSVQNNTKIIDEAMKNAKKNIEVLAEELGIDVEVEIGLQGLIENEDVNIDDIEFNK